MVFLGAGADCGGGSGSGCGGTPAWEDDAEAAGWLDAGVWDEAFSAGAEELSSGGASCWLVSSSSCSLSVANYASFSTGSTRNATAVT